MKKLISTIMCLALLVGCLAGCGGNTQTGAADGKGLKMLLSLSQADTSSEMYLWRRRSRLRKSVGYSWMC